MALSPNGDYVVSASHDKSLRLWERTREPLILEEEREMVRVASFLPKPTSRPFFFLVFSGFLHVCCLQSDILLCAFQPKCVWGAVQQVADGEGWRALLLSNASLSLFQL